MRFDAWNATFPNFYLKDIRSALENDLVATLEPRDKGLHGYQFSETIQVNGVTHGVLAYGGINQRFFVEMKGEPSQQWSEIVQRWDLATNYVIEDDSIFLVYLTRADVCFDWQDAKDVVAIAPGLREFVESEMQEAKGRPPQWDQRGDWNSPEGRARGCTLYMGASSSSVRIRLYDKGAELRGKGLEAPSDLRRVEVQVRADSKEEKVSFSRMTPKTFWTVSSPVKAVATYLRVPMEGEMFRIPSPPADLERLKTLAAIQYGDAITALAKDLATGDMTAIALVEILAKEIETRRTKALRRAS